MSLRVCPAGYSGDHELQRFDLFHDVADAAAGYYHGLAVLRDGSVRTFGRAELLGRKPSTGAKLVASLDSKQIVAVAAGAEHSLVATVQGQVLAWGKGDRGQLGLGREAAEQQAQQGGGQQGVTTAPKLVRGLQAARITHVVCGARHSLCLGDDGRVFAWGDNSQGQLGSGTFVMQHTPAEVSELRARGVCQLAAGANHSIALACTGLIYAFGANSHGELGLGDTQSRLRPTVVQYLSTKQVVKAACGDFHTCFLSQDGIAYTCGSSRWGQCGHGEKSDAVLSPKVVGQLQEIGPCVDVACGRRHTAMVVRCGPVAPLIAFCCGSNSSGQLALPPGHPAAGASERTVPTKSQPCSRVFAGGDATLFAKPPEDPGTPTAAGPQPNPQSNPQPHARPPYLCALGVAECRAMVEAGEFGPLQRRLGTVFGSLACLQHGFVGRLAAQTAGDLPAVRLEAARELVGLVVKGGCPPPVLTALGHGVTQAAKELAALSPLEHRQDPGPLAAYLVLMDSPLWQQHARFQTAIEDLMGVLLRSSAATHGALMREWARHDASYFRRALSVFQAYLAHTIRSKGTASEAVAQCCLALEALHAENGALRVVPEAAFQTPAVGESPDLAEHLRRWDPASRAIFSFCNYPFLLDTWSKAQLLRQATAESMLVAAALQTVNAGTPFLVLTVARDHLLRDTRRVLAQAPAVRLGAPLRVAFAGEEAVDEGGISREFFQLVLPELARAAFSPLVEDGPLLWFAEPVAERLADYHLAGRLIGLALQNGVYLPPLFPGVLFKLLLAEDEDRIEVTLADLADAAPDTVRGLEALLAYDGAGDFAQVFGLTFEGTARGFAGEPYTQELVPGGAGRAVTWENRAEYVARYVRWLVYGRVAASVDAFTYGFREVFGSTRGVLRLFGAADLELACVGKSEFDLHALESVAQYEGYAADAPQVRWLWETVRDDMDEARKRQFLTFVSGTARAPIRGLAADGSLLVRRVAGCPDHLPVAHTCFNHLDLPEYPSRDALRTKLFQALDHASVGFGLV